MIRQLLSLSIILFLAFANVQASSGNKNNTIKKHLVQTKYEAMLSGKDVVPQVKTKASGEATFDFSKDGKKLYYKVIAHNIDGVIMAHIHHAPAGKDGPIAVWLYKGKATGKVNGILSKGIITNKDVNLDSLKTWINEGNAYALIHTKAYPNGELRGTIEKSK